MLPTTLLTLKLTDGFRLLEGAQRRSSMFKVWAFVRRNTARLSHEAYRTGHVGHHASTLRRMKGLRGYCVDVRGDTLHERLGPLHREISFGEPADFAKHWDGLSTLYFDSAETAARAASPEATRATVEGLSVDPDWPWDDVHHLFDSAQDGAGVSPHWQVEEHALLPVARPERRLTKLLQFFRRHPAQPEAAFRNAVLERYARLTAKLPALLGYAVNFKGRDTTPARLGFPTNTALDASASAPTAAFWALWDGVGELHLESLEAFMNARVDLALHPELCVLERHLFESLWYAEVDENIIVMLNRDPAPDFYFR